MQSIPFKLCTIVLCSMMSVHCSGPGSHDVKGAPTKDAITMPDSVAVKSDTPKPVILTYEQRQGKILYTEYCATCHGSQGKGDGFNAYNLDPKPRDFTDPRAMAGIDDATLLGTIMAGGKGVNKSPLMPAWGGRMNKLDIEYVIAYVKMLEQQR